MSSLFSINNAYPLHLLTEMWIALRSEMEILDLILGSETVSDVKILVGHIYSLGHTYSFGAYTSEGKIDNRCDVKPDTNQPNFGRVIPSWISLDRMQHNLRSNWDGLTPDLR